MCPCVTPEQGEFHSFFKLLSRRRSPIRCPSNIIICYLHTPRYCCDLCSDLRLLLYGRDVPVVTPGQFVVADREISLGDAVGSYEPLEKVVYGEVVVDSSA